MPGDLNMFNNYYHQKKVFVTGHTGFKGSWLCLWLTTLGAKAKGYALAPYTKDDHYNVIGLDSKIDSVLGDIRHYDNLKKEVDAFQPDVIFHLAAQPLVRESYLNPRETYETNVMGTVNIFEIARQLPTLQAIVNVTSDKCYDNVEKPIGYKETDPMGGFDPYSSSKGCSELVTAAYRKSFFGQHPALMASARAGNVIGGGDWCKDRIIPDCIRALYNHQPIIVRNPKAVRPWQHVLEPLSGYLLLASQSAKDAKQFSGGWNFGPDHNELVTVQQVVESVVTNWGEGSWQDTSDKNQPHEANLLNLDCTKAHNLLNWQPVLATTESVKYTIDWYKAFKQNDNMEQVSLKQIKDYINGAQTNNIEWSLK